MTDREFDDILGGETQIEPSPEFAAAVMSAVHRDAATPPPIRFPWILALPGLAAWGLTLTLFIALPLYDSGPPAPPAFHFAFDSTVVLQRLGLAFDSLRRFQAGWIVLAVLLTVVCVGFPLRLIRGGSRN